jgi:hypothetical protein
MLTVELLPPTAEEAAAILGRRPVVYVAQETTLNVAPASKFGTLTFLLPAGVQLLLTPQPVIRELRQKLRSYTEHDYLLPLGDPAAIGVICALAADISGGRVSILKWDSMERRYYQVRAKLWGPGA